MTPAEELALLETAYTALLTGGAQSYTVGTRTVTKFELGAIAKRIDLLRIAVQRDQTGIMAGSAFRRPE